MLVSAQRRSCLGFMNTAIKSLLRSRRFLLGFAFGIVLCGLLNYLTYLRDDFCTENVYDCYRYTGFPVAFGVWQGGHYGFDGFIWLGLVTDIFSFLPQVF